MKWTWVTCVARRRAVWLAVVVAATAIDAQAQPDAAAPAATTPLAESPPATAAPAAPDEPVAVAVTLHEPLSPFASVTYEVKSVAGQRVVALTRLHPGNFGSDSTLGFVRDDAFSAALASLAPCAALDAAGGDAPEWELAPSSARGTEHPGDVRWVEAVTVQSDGSERRTAAVGAGAAADACVDAARALAAFVDVPPYEHPFWVDGEFGMLRALSNVPARVYVDGADMGVVTPVHALRLPPGARRVRWVAVRGGAERVEEVTIVVGVTTTVTARFEEAEGAPR